MKDTIFLIEPLLIEVEKYSKTSFELFKLKFIAKTANVASVLMSKLLMMIICFLFVITLNVAIALWLGDLLKKNYYGFFIVAAFYGLVGLITIFIYPFIKNRLNNSIIQQMIS